MSDKAKEEKDFTVLPYTLGGATDPHFIGDGNPPLNRPSQPNETDGPYDGYWRPQDDPHIPGRVFDNPFHNLSAVPVLADSCQAFRSPQAGISSREEIGGEARESTGADASQTERDSRGGTQTLEDKGGNWTPDRVEANEDIYGNDDDHWSLRDEGRSFGEGESYGERNA